MIPAIKFMLMFTGAIVWLMIIFIMVLLLGFIIHDHLTTKCRQAEHDNYVRELENKKTKTDDPLQRN
jgi:hypothetical protein